MSSRGANALLSSIRDVWRSVSPGRRLLLVAALVVGAGSVWWLNRFYGPTPHHLIRRFAAAFNAGDWDQEYSMFAQHEWGGIPLLPKDDLAAILKEMQPPFPTGMRLSGRPVRLSFNTKGRFRGLHGCYLRVLNWGDRELSGAMREEADYFDLPFQGAGTRWRVRAYWMYKYYFYRNYGTVAANRFKAMYYKRLDDLGIAYGREGGRPPAL